MTVAETSKPGPVRSCVGCRTRKRATELVRIALVNGEVAPDLRRLHPGRGAHLCAAAACLERALKRRSFPRAFRRPVKVVDEGLRRALYEAFAVAEARIQASRRQRTSAGHSLAWVEQGLREFTLTNPGAMNRGLASHGQPLADERALGSAMGAHE